MEKTKHEIANECVRQAINALMDCISSDIRELTSKSGDTLTITILAKDTYYEVDYDLVFWVDKEDDTIKFMSDSDCEFSLDDADIGLLCDIQNALLNGNYYNTNE